jgi:hypothetical protein
MRRTRPGPVSLSFCSTMLLCLGGSAAAQSVVTGTVSQDSTRRPLAGVDVVMEKPKRKTVTDEGGRFAFEDVPTGDHVVLFRSVGYRPVRYLVRVADADSVRADVLLVPFAVPLEPLKVTAPPPSSSIGVGGFTERRILGFGMFIDSTELRRNENVRLGDLLGRLGVQVQRTRESAFAVSTSQVGPWGERCPMSVMVDGAMIYRSSGVQVKGMPPPVSPALPPDLNSFLGVMDLQAVEIYRRASEVPLEFGGRTSVCGLIVLWTRRAR